MQQKHVITHPDQADRTRSRQNQNYPEKYFRETILFSYELKLLCVCYYRSPPEIVYLKCYCKFIFFFNLLTIYFTFYFIFVYFSNFRGGKNRESMDPLHERGPWTRSMEGVHGPGVHVLYFPFDFSLLIFLVFALNSAFKLLHCSPAFCLASFRAFIKALTSNRLFLVCGIMLTVHLVQYTRHRYAFRSSIQT